MVDLLYESFPAGTMVDGLPRAWSIQMPLPTGMLICFIAHTWQAMAGITLVPIAKVCSGGIVEMCRCANVRFRRCPRAQLRNYAVVRMWLVEKVHRRVILFAPRRVQAHKRAGHRYTVGAGKLRLLEFYSCNLTFVLFILHIYVMRTRLLQRGVPENVFSISFA